MTILALWSGVQAAPGPPARVPPAHPMATSPWPPGTLAWGSGATSGREAADPAVGARQDGGMAQAVFSLLVLGEMW